MGEIRLTCPECGAEYRIAEGAIPPGGRSVECSSCGAVWHQPGFPAPPGDRRPATDASPPQLNRPLPDSVLSVLREEAELARHQRETATDQGTDRPETALPLQKPAPGPAIEDWPATTITTPLSGPAAMAPDPDALPSGPPPAGPSPSRHINTRPLRPAEAVPAHEVMEATVTRSTPHRAAGPTDAVGDTVEPAHHISPDMADAANARGYRRGLAWGIGIAALLLLLYVIAPRLADQGQAGHALMEWRLTVDDGRAWLEGRVTDLLGIDRVN